MRAFVRDVSTCNVRCLYDMWEKFCRYQLNEMSDK